VSAWKIVFGLSKGMTFPPYLVYLDVALKIDFVQVYKRFKIRYTQSG